MPSTNPTIRFNPCSEDGAERQVAAANWELLRRVPAFQAVAQHWIASEAFRFEHVSEQKAYPANPQARCALDWMLKPEERHALAQYQKRQRLFFSDPAANYGPIVVQIHPENQTTRLEECIDDIFQVTPDPDPGGVVRLDQPWPDTPPKFRAQFVAFFAGPDLKEIKLINYGDTLVRIGNSLVSGGQRSPEELAALGLRLFQLGERLRSLSLDFIILAIRRSLYPERRLDSILNCIKKTLPYDPRTGRDQDSKRSFLGTLDQWDKFLAWEAHARNPYQAAAEFLPKLNQGSPKGKRGPGGPSPSKRQRDIAASVRQAVKAITKWFPRLYPVRILEPSSLRKPNA